MASENCEGKIKWPKRPWPVILQLFRQLNAQRVLAYAQRRILWGCMECQGLIFVKKKGSSQGLESFEGPVVWLKEHISHKTAPLSC